MASIRTWIADWNNDRGGIGRKDRRDQDAGNNDCHQQGGNYCGGAGVVRTFSNGQVGALAGNYITGAAPSVVLNAATVLTTNPTASTAFNGVISGPGAFNKGSALITLDLRGANTYSGLTSITAGTLRLGSYDGGAGVGALGVGGIGSLNPATSIAMTVGANFDLNNATQTVTGFTAVGGSGNILVGSGKFTLSNQITLATFAPVFTANIDGVLNVNGAGNLTLTGNNTNFGGTINVGAGMTLTSNRGGGAINSTTFGNNARVNLVATNSTFVVSQADTIGSLSGAGNTTLTAALTVNSGGGLASGSYSGSFSGGAAVSTFNLSDGSMKLSGNNTNSGGFTITRSSLTLDYSGGATNIVPNPGATALFTLAGAVVLLKGNNTGDSAQSTTLSAGASLIAAPAGDTSRLNLAAITRTTAGSTLHVMNGAAAATLPVSELET